MPAGYHARAINLPRQGGPGRRAEWTVHDLSIMQDMPARRGAAGALSATHRAGAEAAAELIARSASAHTRRVYGSALGQLAAWLDGRRLVVVTFCQWHRCSSPGCVERSASRCSRRSRSAGSRQATTRSYRSLLRTTGRQAVRGRGLGHLAQAEVDAFGEQHVEQTDAVAAGRPGPQVREGRGEPGGVVHLEEDVGDPRLGHPPVEVGDQVSGPVRDGGLRPVDAEDAVFDAGARDRTGPRLRGQPAQTVGQGEPGRQSLTERVAASFASVAALK